MNYYQPHSHQQIQQFNSAASSNHVQLHGGASTPAPITNSVTVQQQQQQQPQAQVFLVRRILLKYTATDKGRKYFRPYQICLLSCVQSSGLIKECRPIVNHRSFITIFQGGMVVS